MREPCEKCWKSALQLDDLQRIPVVAPRRDSAIDDVQDPNVADREAATRRGDDPVGVVLGDDHVRVGGVVDGYFLELLELQRHPGQRTCVKYARTCSRPSIRRGAGGGANGSSWTPSSA